MPDGRVVLLDFGLVLELDAETATTGPAASDPATEAGLIVGTIAYMAPEQAAGDPLTEACDWYAVGVVLYRSLTGRLPFEGPQRATLREKQEREPDPPSWLVSGAPDDLNELCIELLRRDPSTRPDGKEILARLRPRATISTGTADAAAPTDSMPFVGRDRPLKALESAFADMLSGRAVTIMVRGRSGMGKSTLIRRFLDRVAEYPRALVLHGRCYEQESVPYKGLDSLVDSLSRALLRMPLAEVRELLPRSIGGLAKVFPVLLRVPAVADASSSSDAAIEPQELRRVASATLRELLARLGARRPLVLVLDDLQWGDEDCAALLLDLLRPPDPPRFLLVASYRSEYRESSACLRALRSAGEPSHATRSWSELAIEPLEPPEALELARRLLAEGGPRAEALAHRVADESRGVPYFIGELARRVLSGDDRTEIPGSQTTSLEDILWERVRRLPDGVRLMLEVVAAATRPILLRYACEASDLGPEGVSAASTLRSARLLRRSGPSLDDEVEVYHDRIRETIVSRLPPTALRDHHTRLADVLARSPDADAETLAVHFEGAGRVGEAGEAFARAAREAADVLAFDRAARLYRRAIELRPAGGPDGRLLRVRLAEALVNAGRGAEAAREFLAAAAEAPSAEAHELERRAAYQYCISGRVDEGLAALRRVMHRLGQTLPASPSRALISLLLGRLRLAVRGLAFRERPAHRVEPDDLARIDVTWSASTGLTVVDTLSAADLQTRNLLMALRVGEPLRLARALAWEAAHGGVEGEKSRPRVNKLLRAAREIALRSGSPYLDALILLASGAGAYFRGEFPAAREFVTQSERLFRDRCTGVAWELGTAQSFLVWDLFWLGEFAESARLVPTLLREARDRDDLYLETNLCCWAGVVSWLTRGEWAEAREAIRRAMGHWTRASYHSQHMLAMGGEVQIDLYRGDGPAAWSTASKSETELRQSGLMRVQVVRVMYRSLRATAALAVAEGHHSPDSHLAEAGRDAARLLRENARWAQTLGRLHLAALAARRGVEVAAELEEVGREFEALGMKIFAASSRFRLGQLLGGQHGRELREQTLALISAEAALEPERIVAVHAPSFVRSH